MVTYETLRCAAKPRNAAFTDGQVGQLRLSTSIFSFIFQVSFEGTRAENHLVDLAAQQAIHTASWSNQ